MYMPLKLIGKSRARESEQTLIDRSPKPIRKLGKGDWEEYAFANFQTFVKITQMLRPVFMSKGLSPPR